jgi:hypothetical protein
MTKCMVKTIFNYIKKPWEKMCLILLQIHINSYWRFAKRLTKTHETYMLNRTSILFQIWWKYMGIVVAYPIQFPLEIL